MRQEIQELKGCTYYLRYFRDWLDFVACAERVLRDRSSDRFGGMRCDSLEVGDRGWYGTGSLKEAVKLAYCGWPEGRELVQDVRRRMLVDKLLPRAQRLIRNVETSGDEPDIDLFLSGDPEHMVTLHETINPQYGKVLRFALSRSGISNVLGSQMVRRGVAVLTALETLLILGFAVDITIVFSSEQGCYQYEQYVPILHAGDPINLDTLAFMFLQPAVFRRLCFAAKECEPQDIREYLGFYSGGEYARSCQPVFLPDHELFLNWDEGLLDTDSEIVPFVQKTLYQVGVRMSNGDGV